MARVRALLFVVVFSLLTIDAPVGAVASPKGGLLLGKSLSMTYTSVHSSQRRDTVPDVNSELVGGSERVQWRASVDVTVTRFRDPFNLEIYNETKRIDALVRIHTRDPIALAQRSKLHPDEYVQIGSVQSESLMAMVHNKTGYFLRCQDGSIPAMVDGGVGLEDNSTTTLKHLASALQLPTAPTLYGNMGPYRPTLQRHPEEVVELSLIHI